MKGNDISNKTCPRIVFDIDSFLFKEKEQNFISKGIQKFFVNADNRYLDRPVDKDYVRLLERLWLRNDVSIVLVTFTLYDDYYIQRLHEKLYNSYVPYSFVEQMLDWEDLRNFDAMYKFSKNEELLSFLSNKNAMHLDRVGEVFR